MQIIFVGVCKHVIKSSFISSRIILSDPSLGGTVGAGSYVPLPPLRFVNSEIVVKLRILSSCSDGKSENWFHPMKNVFERIYDASYCILKIILMVEVSSIMQTIQRIWTRITHRCPIKWKLKLTNRFFGFTRGRFVPFIL